MAMLIKPFSSWRPIVKQLCNLFSAYGKKSSQNLTLYPCIRSFSVFNNKLEDRLPVQKTNCINNYQNTLLPCQSNNLNQIRHYKAKNVLRLRCKGCFFIKRRDRLFVECKLKPRHKQMQMVPKHDLYKEDYSKGDIKKACFWGYQNDAWYRRGDNQFSKHNWLEDKIGRTI